MLGSNDLASSYYGQGPTEGTTFTVKALSAVVTVSASLSVKLLINKALSATITTTATISRQFQRTINTAVTTTGAISSLVIKALNIIRGITKFNTGGRTTRNLNEVMTTQPAAMKRTIRRIKDE